MRRFLVKGEAGHNWKLLLVKLFSVPTSFPGKPSSIDNLNLNLDQAPGTGLNLLPQMFQGSV